MSESLEQKILSYLKDTGYPLELEAASALESLGWSVSTSPIYLDPDEGKYREYDVSGVRVWRVDSSSPIDPTVLLSGHAFAYVLCVECKRSGKPWVFFTRPAGVTRTKIQYSSTIKNLITYFDSPSTVLNESILVESMWYFGASHRSRNFVEAFKTESQPSQIYSALNQVVKATRYQREQYDQPPTKNISACLFPVIVLDGEMFEAQLQSGNIALQPTNHVIVEFDYISRENPFKTEQFLVDVVRKDYMTDFFTEVDSGLNKASGHVRDGFLAGTIELEP